MNTEAEIEREIQEKGLNAPRLRPEDIDAAIVASTFTHLPSRKALVCELTLRNGFTVRGESACVSVENFDQEIGCKIALENARNKVWELEGYRLQCELASAQKLLEEGQIMENIARVCHEVNRAYCQALGDDSQLPWAQAPEWARSSARMGVDLHTMGDFGPEASHISWMKQKLDEGWKFGPVKDADKKEHPCLVPFAELPREQQAKDYIFRAVVHALLNK